MPEPAPDPAFEQPRPFAPAPEPAPAPAPAPANAFESIQPPIAAPPPAEGGGPAPGGGGGGGRGGNGGSGGGGTPLGGLPDPEKEARDRAAALEWAARQRLRGLVRDVRAHAQAVLDGIAPVRAALKLTDDSTRDAELEKALKEFRRTTRDQIPAIDDFLVAARGVLDAYPGVYDSIGDAVTNIETAWARARRSLDLVRTAEAAAAGAHLDDIEGDIATMFWHAAVVTMPARVNDHLRTLNVGDELDFGEAFSDELPTASARRRMLAILRSHPGSVTGEVDVEHGVIYKSGKLPRRLVSYAFLLLLIGPAASLFIGLITTGSSLLNVPQALLFPPTRHDEIWVAYLAILGGVLFHLLVESIKQAQRSTDQAFLALGHWLIWIHVREMSLAVTVLTMWVVTIALGLNMPKVDPSTAFFAGYSIDSVIGVILTRFDGLAKTSDDALLKRLTPTAPAAASAATGAVPTS